MQTKIIEACNGSGNWGKFLLGRMDDEWSRTSAVDDAPDAPRLPLLSLIGWGPSAVLVLDLQTREAAVFTPGGHAPADLCKHKIWVCPLFEPFLIWLYTVDVADLDALPDHVDLPDAAFAYRGHRRPGPAPHPGVQLRLALADLRMTQTQLAAETGRPPQTISEICCGKHPVTPQMALKLEEAVGIDAEWWVHTQGAYDVEQARATLRG